MHRLGFLNSPSGDKNLGFYQGLYSYPTMCKVYIFTPRPPGPQMKEYFKYYSLLLHSLLFDNVIKIVLYQQERIIKSILATIMQQLLNLCTNLASLEKHIGIIVGYDINLVIKFIENLIGCNLDVLLVTHSSTQ